MGRREEPGEIVNWELKTENCKLAGGWTGIEGVLGAGGTCDAALGECGPLRGGRAVEGIANWGFG